jgi:hypothetical protein
MELQAIFEQADQCLVIDDPLRGVLDQIHQGIAKNGTPAYLLGKLPLSITSSPVDPAETLLKRSFAAFRARAIGDEEWIKTRIAAAVAARPIIDLPDQGRWMNKLLGQRGCQSKPSNN